MSKHNYFYNAWLCIRVMHKTTFLKYQSVPPVFLLHRSSWLKKGIDHENRTKIEESANFLTKKCKGGTLLSKKYFFLILTSLWVSIWPSRCTDSRTVWNFAVWPPWVEILAKICLKMLKLPILWFLALFGQFFCQYLCLGTLHSKILYRSGISASGRSNWYP